MTSGPAQRNVRIHQRLHPGVYAVLAVNVLWMVAACWIFFSQDLYTALQVAVVTFFAAAFMLTPLCLWRLSGQTEKSDLTYREWSEGELDVLDGPVEAKHAALMVLLAPMAGAVGITAIGFVAALASRGML
jgi:hypothetical protein